MEIEGLAVGFILTVGPTLGELVGIRDIVGWSLGIDDTDGSALG